MTKKNNTVRIIAGTNRRRLLSFPTIEGLRPTMDSIRETLFSWLIPHIEDSECLDLYAGTGALGFEALSRGAKSVTFVENDSQVMDSLRKNAEMLKCDNAHFIHRKLPDTLKKTSEKKFDIAFIDPPYYLGQVNGTCKILNNSGWLKPNALIYIEHEQSIKNLKIPENWELIKDKKSGQVRYGLYRVRANS